MPDTQRRQKATPSLPRPPKAATKPAPLYPAPIGGGGPLCWMLGAAALANNNDDGAVRATARGSRTAQRNTAAMALIQCTAHKAGLRRVA